MAIRPQCADLFAEFFVDGADVNAEPLGGARAVAVAIAQRGLDEDALTERERLRQVHAVALDQAPQLALERAGLGAAQPERDRVERRQLRRARRRQPERVA